jgi:hypothetical protein
MLTRWWALAFFVGVAVVTAQDSDSDPIELEAFCQSAFPGTHWDPESGRCKSAWDGNFDNPAGSLFDVWPSGFDRKLGNLAFDGGLAGKKYLLVHHENPGWDPTQDLRLWEILFFRDSGFLERRLFSQLPEDWDDDRIEAEILGRWETGTWQGESYTGAPMMRILLYSIRTAVRLSESFSVPQFYFYDTDDSGEFVLSNAMTLKLPLSGEGDDQPPPPPNEIYFQVMQDIEIPLDSSTAVETRAWGVVKAGTLE